MTAPVVTVYSKPSCQQCTATKRWLDARGIPYDTADLLDPDNLAMVKALGHMQAPVVTHGDNHWSGFRPDLLERHLT